MTAGVDGGVRSTFTVEEDVAVRPARSVATPLRINALPSLLPVDAAGGHEATPESASAHVKVARRRCPAPTGGVGWGATAAEIVGGVASILNVTLVDPPSDAVTSMTWVPLARPPGTNGAK